MEFLLGLLKPCADKLVKPLQILVNSSFSDGKFPYRIKIDQYLKRKLVKILTFIVLSPYFLCSEDFWKTISVTTFKLSKEA